MPYSNYVGLTLVTPPSGFPVSVADVKAHSRIYVDTDDSLISGYIAAATIVCEDQCRRAFMPQTWRLALEQFPGRSPEMGYREANRHEYYQWNKISLPKPPLTSIVSFTYADTLGNTQNMQQGFTNVVGNYLLDLESEPGRIVLPFAGIWPTTILLPGPAILITYNCGYPAYSGVLQVTVGGIANWISGDKFSPNLVGTWINIGGQSLNVVAYNSPIQIQLSASILPVDHNETFTANEVPQPIRGAILYLAAHFYENREPIITGRSETAIEIPKTVDAMLTQYEIFRT